DEEGARRALDEAVRRRSITLFERDRALRESRERQLAAMLAQPRASFTLSSLEPPDVPPRAASPLGAPLRLAVVEAARRGIDVARAQAILGGPVSLRRTARFDAVAAEGFFAPELAALMTRCDGASLEQLVDEAAGEPGIAGLV